MAKTKIKNKINNSHFDVTFTTSKKQGRAIEIAINYFGMNGKVFLNFIKKEKHTKKIIYFFIDKGSFSYDGCGKTNFYKNY
jgi:hypothetical protein